MLINRIVGTTRVIGQSQGYLGLPLRDETNAASGQPQMRSSWSPTPEELARLNAGASIELIVLGRGHPPVLLEVGAPPEWQR